MKMEDLMKMTVEQLEEIEAELWNEWEMVNSALKVVRYYSAHERYMNKVDGEE